MSDHLSAAGRAQDSESSPVKDRRSTTVPRSEPCYELVWLLVTLVHFDELPVDLMHELIY